MLNRRSTLLTLFSIGCAAFLPTFVFAKDFASTRISVRTAGSGSDVILIPGLASSPRVWTEMVNAIPGHRYHLIQVSGFAGQPVGSNNEGLVAAPVAEEIARYIAEQGLQKTVTACDVARREDMRNARAQPIVNDDAVDGRGHACAVETETLNVRSPPYRNQEVRAGHLRARVGLDDHGVTLVPDGPRMAAFKTDTLSLTHPVNHVGCLRIVMWEQSRRHNRDLTAKPLKRLSEFHPERTAADHDERRRKLLEIEDGVVRQVRHAPQTVDIRQRRRGTRANEEAACVHRGCSNPQRPRIEE